MDLARIVKRETVSTVTPAEDTSNLAATFLPMPCTIPSNLQFRRPHTVRTLKSSFQPARWLLSSSPACLGLDCRRSACNHELPALRSLIRSRHPLLVIYSLAFPVCVSPALFTSLLRSQTNTPIVCHDEYYRDIDWLMAANGIISISYNLL